MNFLTPCIPDQPHPTQRDTDGYAKLISGSPPQRFTREPEWTPEQIAHVAEREREHRDWLASVEGQEWFAKQTWNT